jgi:hypothetical protein
VDATAAWEGQALDTAVTDAILSHLSESMNVAGETEVYVVDSAGKEQTVTVFE